MIGRNYRSKLLVEITSRNYWSNDILEYTMQDFLKYLSTAPVLATAWMLITAALLIGFNWVFPDLLFHPMP